MKNNFFNQLPVSQVGLNQEGISMQTRLGIVGLGGMARHHLKNIVTQRDTTEIVAVCEPSKGSYEKGCEFFREAGMAPPPNQPELSQFIKTYAGKLDAVFILTPHVYHYEQAKTCMEAGLDVLLEKPMVMNTGEAVNLIDVRDRTGRLLVVGFQGGLSPAIRKTGSMLLSGELGELLSISGTIWQDWVSLSSGTWRAKPEISGGGFMFDSGAHMLNTVCDLAGEDFARVAAWLDNRGSPVDVMATVMGRLMSGALVTISGCGKAIPSCASEVYVFCTKAIIRTGIWGERFEIQKHGEKDFTRLETMTVPDAWEVFLRVRRGEIPNPCPPEVGLRMARLWDAIKASAAQNGEPVDCTKQI